MLHSDNLARVIVNQKKITNTRFFPISHIDSVRLSEAAISDAKNIAQVAFATLCEGIAGASQNRFSWATVKLYYCAFHSLRARLLLSEQIVFYRGRTPYSILSLPGQTARRRSGNTHSAVFTIFSEMFPQNDLFVQEIEGMPPLRWLESKRNECSYALAPLPDPAVPAEFDLFLRSRRSALQQFIYDDSLAFDSDTAIIALPIWLLSELSTLIAIKFGDRSIPIHKHFSDILASQRLWIRDLSTELRCFDFAN